MNNNKFSIFPWIIAILGIISLGSGAIKTKMDIRFFINTIQVEGTVIDIITVINYKRNQIGNTVRAQDTYKPVIQFKLPSGKTLTHTPDISSNPVSYNKGEKAPILYDPNTGRPEIYRFMSLWLSDSILIILGLLLFILSTISIVYSFINRNPSEKQ
ncbi:DUF3592 domain-containing protein [Entomomonas sp. E2T0]|uniref:DUF3592 domain-containing protein n=1 Tax=Entomomonas sp. E2T0 TaxID=2930213 RepID=UPI0022281176|nr:DUF3592 domain-containing protein [Entomomonas sp. E2T0]UYZ85351.1 DUF3592 domain-containing protein [Entomomonas sp. E2T0]